MSASVSISKLKSELRQAQRLLSRNDRLNASLRVETERRVESLKSQIEEEQKRRGVQEGEATSALTTKATAAQNGSDLAATADASKSASETAPAVEKKKKSTKKEDKYKMLRHVEFKKSTRRLKQAERDLASVTSQLEGLPASDGKDSRKARKALEKQKSAAEAKRDQARIDAWYGSVRLTSDQNSLQKHTGLPCDSSFSYRLFRHSSSMLRCTHLATMSNSEIYPLYKLSRQKLLRMTA